VELFRQRVWAYHQMIEDFLLVTVFALGGDLFVGFGFVFPSGKLVTDEFQEIIVGRGIVVIGTRHSYRRLAEGSTDIISHSTLLL
jgi:hypothetical protein